MEADFIALPGASHESVECLHPRRHRATPLAVSEFLKRRELYDPTAIDRGRDLADAAGHHLLAEALLQDVDMAHSVQHRHDRRFRTDGGREIMPTAHPPLACSESARASVRS